MALGLGDGLGRGCVDRGRSGNEDAAAHTRSAQRIEQVMSGQHVAGERQRRVSPRLSDVRDAGAVVDLRRPQAREWPRARDRDRADRRSPGSRRRPCETWIRARQDDCRQNRPPQSPERRHAGCSRFSVLSAQFVFSFRFGSGSLFVFKVRVLACHGVAVLRQPVKAKEEFEPLIDPCEFCARHLPEHPTDTSLVDGSDVIDERIRCFGEATAPRRERRIERPRASGASDRHDSDEWKSLVSIHSRIAHYDARAHSSLLVTHGRIEFDEKNSAACHSGSLTQPCPSTQRTAVPVEGSRSLSSSGNSEVQSANPASTNWVVSG